MTTTKKWVALTLAAALIVLGGGWLLLVSPQRQAAADLTEEALLQEATNAQLATRLEVLRAKAAQLPDKKAEIAQVAARIPAQPALPDLVRALTAAASSAGVELVSVAPGTPAPVTSTPAGDAPAGADAVEAAAPAGLSMIPLTINVVGAYYDVEEFVASLEDLPRALRLTALTLVPGSGPSDGGAAASVGSRSSLAATVTAQVYLAGAPAAAPAAAPAGASVASEAGAAPAVGGVTAEVPDAAPAN